MILRKKTFQSAIWYTRSLPLPLTNSPSAHSVSQHLPSPYETPQGGYQRKKSRYKRITRLHGSYEPLDLQHSEYTGWTASAFFSPKQKHRSTPTLQSLYVMTQTRAISHWQKAKALNGRFVAWKKKSLHPWLKCKYRVQTVSWWGKSKMQLCLGLCVFRTTTVELCN